MLRSSGRSNSSNSLAAQGEPSVAASSSVQAIPTASSRPVNIAPQRTAFDRRPHDRAPAIAQSAPTLSWVPPPPPSARPRIANVEPPPFTLPPSPPVFSQMQIEQAREETKNTAMQIQQHQQLQQQQKQKYSRSLSSSAPSHHIDYLSAFRASRELPTTTAHSTVTDITDDEEIDDESLHAGGVAIQQSSAAGRRQQRILDQDAAQLSKSPTIFSILTQHGPAGTAAALQSHPQPQSQSVYRRSSLVETLIDEGEEEEEDDRHLRGSADELQFSISLDGGEEEEGSAPDDLSLY